MQPTSYQRLIASDLLPKLWVTAVVPGAVVIWTLCELAPTGESLRDRASFGLLLGCLALAYLTGWCLAIPTGWVVFGPFLMGREEVNGGPFSVGDCVMILYGPHANQISTVYATWQDYAVRVELGEAAKSQFEDIFPGHKLLRAATRPLSADRSPANAQLSEEGA